MDSRQSFPERKSSSEQKSSLEQQLFHFEFRDWESFYYVNNPTILETFRIAKENKIDNPCILSKIQYQNKIPTIVVFQPDRTQIHPEDRGKSDSFKPTYFAFNPSTKQWINPEVDKKEFEKLKQEKQSPESVFTQENIELFIIEKLPNLQGTNPKTHALSLILQSSNSDKLKVGKSHKSKSSKPDCLTIPLIPKPVVTEEKEEKKETNKNSDRIKFCVDLLWTTVNTAKKSSSEKGFFGGLNFFGAFASKSSPVIDTDFSRAKQIGVFVLQFYQDKMTIDEFIKGSKGVFKGSSLNSFVNKAILILEMLENQHKLLTPSPPQATQATIQAPPEPSSAPETAQRAMRRPS